LGSDRPGNGRKKTPTAKTVIATQELPQRSQAPDLIHEALLYRTPKVFAEQVSAFVCAGQSAGEPVLAVLPPDSLQQAQSVLAARAAQVQWTSMLEVGGNPACLLSVYQDWIDAHPGPVRVIGEPVWPGRSYAETTECLRHEALLNRELAGASVSALCPYDAARLDPAVLMGAELTHPQLVDDAGRRWPSERYDASLDFATGARWPQREPTEPVSEHVFRGDLQSLRHAVAGDMVVGVLDRERRSDLVFATSEAAANALKHGDGTGTVRLWRDGDAIVSEVVTQSSVADPLAGRRRPDRSADDGRGLWLINQICDLVELRSDARATVLRMHVRVAAVPFAGRTAG